MERLPRYDRVPPVALIGAVFVLAGLYTIFGVGMLVRALLMTAVRGIRDVPGLGVPGKGTEGRLEGTDLI